MRRPDPVRARKATKATKKAAERPAVPEIRHAITIGKPRPVRRAPAPVMGVPAKRRKPIKPPR